MNCNRYKNTKTEYIINKEIKDQQNNFQRKLSLKKIILYIKGQKVLMKIKSFKVFKILI